jgi:foldase protein PrsA
MTTKKTTVLSLMLMLVFVLVITSCQSKTEEMQLQEGTPAYALAKDLTSQIPALDPDLKTVLIETKDFSLTSNEVILFVRANLGAKSEQLKELSADELKKYVDQNARLMADRKLILAEAEAAGIAAPPDQIEQILEAQAAKTGGMDQYTKLLADNEITLDHVRQSIKFELIIQSFLENVLGKDVEITDDEINTMYSVEKSASVRHILLLTQGKSEEEKPAIRKKMEAILARAKSGQDFAALAKEHTEDPGSKENGGLYEDFSRGTMVKPFEDAAFSVPVGEISDIVETEYGYHILKVENRKKETRPLDEVRTELREQIKNTKINQKFLIYMNDLRQQKNLTVNSL